MYSLMTPIAYSGILSKRAGPASSQDALDFDGFDLAVGEPLGGLRNDEEVKFIL